MKNLFIKKSALETFMTELYRKGSWKSVSIKWNTEFQNQISIASMKNRKTQTLGNSGEKLE